MEENIYYLDVVGYNDYLQRISALEEELKSFLATRSTEAKDILLDEHYSSATSCDLVRREKLILDNLQDLRKKRDRIKIIEKHGEDTRVDIGDRLSLEIMFASHDVEEMETELTATIGTLHNEDKISINSPLGRALYNQVIGGIYTYQVGERKMSVHIKQKLLTEDKPVERK